MRIWIDLANTPHVLFFAPVIAALERRGHTVTVTARRFANTLEVARARGVAVQHIGAGYDAGRDERRKRAAHERRTAQLVAFARQGFDVAASHGSYTQIAAARHLGIPVFGAVDYEHPGLGAFGDARLVMAPAVLPVEALTAVGIPAHIVRPYDGLKEHVSLAGFRPDPTLRARLGIAAAQRLVTVRPIPPHAVYLDGCGTGVQRRLVERLAAEPGVCVLVVPRTAAQRRRYDALARRLPAVRVLAEAVDGPALIHASDLVVCGGGTMLREAAVLGVPAVSIFSGPLGAVDRWLASEARVLLVRRAADADRIQLARRPPPRPVAVPGVACAQVVQGICDAAAGG